MTASVLGKLCWLLLLINYNSYYCLQQINAHFNAFVSYNLICILVNILTVWEYNSAQGTYIQIYLNSKFSAKSMQDSNLLL